MRLTMKERKVVTKAMASQYRRASKGKKGQILDRFVEATGYNRHHAAWLLRNHGRQVQVAPKVVFEGNVRQRPRAARECVYGEEVVEALKKVWTMMDCICGKRLAPVLPELVSRLVGCRELRVSKAVQQKLVQISPATIDRLLKKARAKHQLKGRATTKPGTLLKHQIPVRTFSDWDDAVPGFFEMDLVGHDGGSTQGDYCFTLDLTDIATGWVEQAAVPNKAQVWVFEALQDICRRLPFGVLGLHSDNGSEFINNQMKRFSETNEITFTRGRPYRKNDTCHIEQKNWSIVRRQVGYARYDKPGACELLNEFYLVLRDYNNFFMPSMKCVETTRDGARTRKRYDTAQTPYHRLLNSTKVPDAVKKRLTNYYERLNPAALYRQIKRMQKDLMKQASRVETPESAEVLSSVLLQVAPPLGEGGKAERNGKSSNKHKRIPAASGSPGNSSFG